MVSAGSGTWHHRRMSEHVVYWPADEHEVYAPGFLDGMVGKTLPVHIGGEVHPYALLRSYEVVDDGRGARLTLDL